MRRRRGIWSESGPVRRRRHSASRWPPTPIVTKTENHSHPGNYVTVTFLAVSPAPTHAVTQHVSHTNTDYGQLAQWCDELAADPALGHAEHAREEINHIAAVMNAEEAAQAFRAACGHAVALADTLSKAQTALSPLYHAIDDEH
jgi:hypothetical protein